MREEGGREGNARARHRPRRRALLICASAPPPTRAGDWALRRTGALHLENTERVTVAACAFVRTDANAIVLSSYNRNASVLDSAFQWLGMSAVALLGDTEQDDGTAGLQPWGTTVAGCAFSELGVIEKQSSALGKSALTRFEANVAWNMPRAAVNFNDVLGGGHNVTANAIFNTCRESGDHGPLNSWHRMPMASRIATRGGDAVYAAAMSEVHRNYIDASYGGSQAFDNDDGSAFWHADLVAPSLGSQPCAGLPHGSGVLIAYANRYFTAHANASARCGDGTAVRVADLPPPMEAGSSSHPLPDGLTVMQWAREKLGI